MQSIMDKTYKAAIYLRLSKEDGDFSSCGEKKESNSIANQRLLIHGYLTKHPEIVSTKEFCDDGFSGATFDRPSFQEMIEAVRNKEINCIIVKDLSRFGRDYIEAGRFIQKEFPQLGVRFIAINDNYDTELNEQASNDIILPFKNLINDSYSRDISIKVRSNLEVKRRNGEFVGPHVIYGYERSTEGKSHLVIDTTAAPVVERIFSMKIDGFSPVQIANKLNEEGIPSPYEHKRLQGKKFDTSFRKNAHAMWSGVAVYRILKDEVYSGVLVQGKTTTPNHKVKIRTRKEESQWARIENAHDAIISPATFDMVQHLLLEDTRSPTGGRAVHLFSGKIYCADCHSAMVRKKTSSGRNGKNQYVYFICGANKNDKNVCSAHRINEQDIYDAVLEVIKAQVSLALELEPALQKLGGVSWERRELGRIQNQIVHQEEIVAHTKKMKTTIYEDFKMDFINLDEYKMLKSDCDEKIRAAMQTIEELRRNANKVQLGLTEQQTWIGQFRQYENIEELNRRVVVHFVDHIEISADKEIHIFLNNSDQFETIQGYIREGHNNELQDDHAVKEVG